MLPWSNVEQRHPFSPTKAARSRQTVTSTHTGRALVFPRTFNATHARSAKFFPAAEALNAVGLLKGQMLGVCCPSSSEDRDKGPSTQAEHGHCPTSPGQQVLPTCLGHSPFRQGVSKRHERQPVPLGSQRLGPEEAQQGKPRMQVWVLCWGPRGCGDWGGAVARRALCSHRLEGLGALCRHGQGHQGPCPKHHPRTSRRRGSSSE